VEARRGEQAAADHVRRTAHHPPDGRSFTVVSSSTRISSPPLPGSAAGSGSRAQSAARSTAASRRFCGRLVSGLSSASDNGLEHRRDVERAEQHGDAAFARRTLTAEHAPHPRLTREVAVRDLRRVGAQGPPDGERGPPHLLGRAARSTRLDLAVPPACRRSVGSGRASSMR
jgi:hypothetical protein